MASLAASISRAFTPQSEWPDKEEFLDVIYWGRQVGRLNFYTVQCAECRVHRNASSYPRVVLVLIETISSVFKRD